MNPNEQEIIEISLAPELNHLLIRDLERTIGNIVAKGAKNKYEQFRFLESVLRKSKEKKPRMFCARECSTIAGYLTGAFQLSKNGKFKVMANLFDNGLKKWEEETNEKKDQ